jgi:hypothetical protein
MAETKPMQTGEVHSAFTERAREAATPLDTGAPVEFTPEQLATPPSCPPLVGGMGPETPEVAKARETAEQRRSETPEQREERQAREAQETPEQRRQREAQARAQAETPEQRRQREASERRRT